MTIVDLAKILVEDAFWSGIAALGFAMLFNVPRRALIACVACGAVGHAVRTLMMEYFSMTIAPSTLVGATIVGFMGYFFAHYYEIPSAVFTVSGAIPMVPGVFAYRTMIHAIRITSPDTLIGQQALLDASVNGMTTALILAGIAVGIAAPSLLFERHRPVV